MLLIKNGLLCPSCSGALWHPHRPSRILSSAPPSWPPSACRSSLSAASFQSRICRECSDAPITIDHLICTIVQMFIFWVGTGLQNSPFRAGTPLWYVSSSSHPRLPFEQASSSPPPEKFVLNPIFTSPWFTFSSFSLGGTFSGSSLFKRPDDCYSTLNIAQQEK